MKLSSKSRVLLTVAGLSSLLFAGAASADYRVTAFGYSSEYDALLEKDVASASSILSDRSLARLDFVEANNLCVTQILAKDFATAASSCAVALDKVESDYGVGLLAKKFAKASIYSNLGVAMAMSGDVAAASEAFEMALSLNSRDKNAVANYSLISEMRPASGLAQSN